MLGANIKRKMLEQGISQRELAKRVNITEVSMSRYIKGTRVPKGTLLVKIAGALGCSVEELLKDDCPKKIIDVSELTDEEIAAVNVLIRCMVQSRSRKEVVYNEK